MLRAAPAQRTAFHPANCSCLEPLRLALDHRNGGRTIIVQGFFDGDNLYRLRFSPPKEGRWHYTTASSHAAMHGRTGKFLVIPAPASKRGPVSPRSFGLYHADGSPHFSVGTTAYAWPSQPAAVRQQTLETLRKGFFNKVRMSPFPKRYQYNNANPVEAGAAFEILPGSAASDPSVWGCVGPTCPPTNGSFNLRRFNVTFWRNFEGLVQQMGEMNVIADIILFHPYDGGHWGFDCLGGREAEGYQTAHDRFYLRYIIARLGAYSNVWWSLANEWPYVRCKARGTDQSLFRNPSLTEASPAPVWDELFIALDAYDAHKRMRSIHNAELLYDYSRHWITHISLQGVDPKGVGYTKRLRQSTAALRTRYGKPVIWDEVWYEGNMPCSEETGSGCIWGALSAEAMADRFWLGASLGAYVGHGETMAHDATLIQHNVEAPLWWAKGGKLAGRSPQMIKWFGEVWAAVLASVDFPALVPGTLPHGGGETAAETLVDPLGSFMFIHAGFAGEWAMPLPVGAEDWLVGHIRFASMRWENSTLPHGTKHATLKCNAPPCNFMIFRQYQGKPLIDWDPFR